MSKQGHVLIVDDEKQWRDELVETLDRGGLQADSVPTAAEALERLNQRLYHVLVLDIRMNESDFSNVDGIDLLDDLDRRGLTEATKVIMLSAYGTKEQMRKAFRDYKVADFISKGRFDDQAFLESVQKSVQQVFSKDVHINLALEVHWQQVSGPAQVVLNLDIGGTRIRRNTPLQGQVATELEDLLCRLFYEAKSVMVRPLTPGRSGTAVISAIPFYTTGGGGREVIVKFGDVQKVEEEYSNFKQYVQPFVGGGRNTTVLAVRHTPHLGGIIYSLLGTINDQLVDFGDFYYRSGMLQIRDTLNRLFRDTCGAWYANRGPLHPLDLTADYQRMFAYSAERLEQVRADQLKTVQGKQKLHFRNLKGERAFTNPILATTGVSLVRPTYISTTHGDFNQHNLLVDSSGHVWLIDFQGTGQSHILRDVSMLDSAVRFQLLTANEATLEERLRMEEALCSIPRFSRVEQLATSFSTENAALAKVYATVVHLRKLAYRLVEQNPRDDISEYYIALLYNALHTLCFSSLSSRQREHALLCASLLVDRLRLSS